MGSNDDVDTVSYFGSDTVLCDYNNSDVTSVSSSMSECYADSENDWFFIFGLITVWTLTAVTIYGNCLVLMSFVINKNIRSKPANVFILTLSFADLTVGTISLPPNNIWVQYGYWPFGKILCKAYLFFDFTACAVSSACIILLSLDRYWMVKKHLKYNAFMTHRRAFILSISVVLFIVAFYGVSIFFWEMITGESTIDYAEDCEVEGVDNVIFGSLSIALEFAFPFTVLLFLNINVYIEIINWSSGKNLRRGVNVKKTKKQIDQYKTQENTTGKDENSDNKAGGKNLVKQDSFRRFQASKRGSQTRKAAVMLAVLVTVFVICWTPYNICIMMDSVEISDFVWECVNYLLWFNSGINPILYAVTNEQFRQTFIRIIFCRWNEDNRAKLTRKQGLKSDVSISAQSSIRQ